MRIERLLERIAGAVEGCGAPASLQSRIGRILAEEFPADGWAFYRADGEGGFQRLAGGGKDVFPLRFPTGEAFPPVDLAGDDRVPAAVLVERSDPGMGTFVLCLPRGSGGGALSAALGCAGVAVGNAWKMERLARRAALQDRSFRLLTSISRTLTGDNPPEAFVALLAECCRENLGAAAGVVSIVVEGWGGGDGRRAHVFPESLGRCLRPVAEGRKAALTADVPAPRGTELAILEIPLRHEGGGLGRIVLWVPSAEPLLLPEAREFLEELSSEISLRVVNVALHQRAESLAGERQKRLQELWILQETNKALRGTLKLNVILKMILAAATVESGLGFNRAALFLLNERTEILQGMLGVGPDSMEDADRIWRSLTTHSDLGLARQIELYSETQPPSSGFDSLVKSIRIPLGGGTGILSHCVRTGTPVLYPSGMSFPSAETELLDRLRMSSFAATPIVSREQVFGVMVVDNLYDGKPITEEDLRLLTMFAAQAGLAIANAKAHRSHQLAAEELRRVRDQLVQSERLAVLGEVAANLAHEIRNPLVTIGGFARRMEKKLDPADPNRRYTTIISGEVMRLEHFLEEILFFGQDRRPALRSLDLNEVMLGAVRLFDASFAEAGITVKADLDEELPPLQGDPGQLRQVFVNLFANAVDAMGDGGVLDIATGTDKGPPPAVFASVGDTGGGVSPDVLGNIFSPFFTTKSGGHGLGLALTQRIVSEHAGRISVKNQPGQGLTVIVALPCAVAAAAANRHGGPDECKGGVGA